MKTEPGIQIRPATFSDTRVLLKFIQDLAHYEKLSDQCFATEESLATHLFGPHPRAEALIATWAGQPAGFALFFHNFSTFVSKPGLYLEDLFVEPDFRRKGIGRALLVELARIAELRGCGRFEWSVLDWNKPAHDFYESLGGKCLTDWRIFRVAGEGIKNLAASRPGH